MTGAPSAKLLAAKLWEKTSAAGNRYFAGRLGGVKLLILENRDRGGEDDPTHHLFFVDGETRRPDVRGAHANAPARRRSASRQPHRNDADAPTEAMPDDHVDDLYQGAAS